MKTSNTKRCAIYTRKSSEEGLDQDFNSLAAQREACEAYVVSQRSEGWITLPDLYDDGGFSGGNLNRPAMQELLVAIDAGDIDVLVVYKIDRLTRSLADFAKLVEKLDAHEVSIVAVTQPFNTTTSMGRLTLNVLLSFAQFEREITGERIRDKIAASKRKGMWMGGCVPLGYDAAERKLIVNEAEAEKVRHIFQRYLAIGSIYKLQEELHRDGIRSKARISKDGTPRGNARFSRGALYPLLRSRIYVGEITHQGESFPGQHNAILDQELFDKVQLKLKENSHSHIRRAKSPSLLAGKLYDDMGNRLYPCHANKQGKRYRYYVSKAVINGGRSKTRARWPAQSLELFIRQQLAEHIADPQLWCSGESIPPISLNDQTAEAARHVLKHPSGDQLLRDLVASASLSDTNVTIVLDSDGLQSHLPVPDDLQLQTRWTVPLSVRSRHNGERRIIAPGQADEPDPVLLKALLNAHQWQVQLTTGQYSSIALLAQVIGRSTRDVKRTLNLVYLSPDLKKSIIEGTQSDAMTLQVLTKSGPIPTEFQEQHIRWSIAPANRSPDMDSDQD